MTAQATKIAALYERLSRDDESQGESNSIINQKAFLEDYAKRNSFTNIRHFTDDGVSGTTFDRKGFQAMIAEVEAGTVATIIVKDMSRFGRDYLKVGLYTDVLFKDKGVRFIAINNGIDSDKQGDNDFTPFLNIMNDAYCRDISVKIRSQLEVKRKKGDFIGSFAVYGYLKDPNDRHKLVVDDYAADVVRDIFRWKLEGMSQQRIAERLDDNGILSPMEYKCYCGMSYKSGFQINPKAKWTAVAIGRILKNEFYVGTLVQGKRSAPNHKIKKLFEKPKSEWVRIENSHEAIVEQEIFNTVNRLLSKDTRIAPQEKTVYLFGGMLFCGDCHSNMVRNNNCRNGKTYTYYMCGNNRNTKGCSSHRMRDTVLENAVLSCLKQHIDNILNVEQVLKRIDTLPYRKSGAGRVNGQLEQKTEEIERYKHFKMKLHESLVDNLLEKNEYLDMKAQYDQQQTAAEKDMLRLEKELQTAVYSVSNECGWMDAFRQYQDIAVLTRAVVVTLIDHIVIYENNRIEIVFQYQYDYEQALAVIASFDNEKHPALMERGVL